MTVKELPVLREKGVCCALPEVDADWVESTAGLMKALADPARLTMVAALWKAKAPVCICDFTADLELAQATVSHHMAKLREAGLVEWEKNGIWTYYSLRRDLPTTTRRLLAQLITQMNGRPEVLFVCVHNAGRSQMAAALLGLRGQGRIEVRSAGSEPAAHVNPAVVQAMSEIGLDISKEMPKPLTGGAVRAADVVITMGCGDACPIFPGKRYVDWDLEDPAGKSLAQVRPIRDEIDRRVRELAAELLADQPRR